MQGLCNFRFCSFCPIWSFLPGFGVPTCSNDTGPSLGENESTKFPGWTFEIFRFSIIEIFYFGKTFMKNMLVRYRGINDKGVPDRPWTIWKVLRSISSAVECQSPENHENEKIWLFGGTERRRPGVYKVAQGVSAHFCLANTPSIAIWGQQKQAFRENPVFFQVH